MLILFNYIIRDEEDVFAKTFWRIILTHSLLRQDNLTCHTTWIRKLLELQKQFWPASGASSETRKAVYTEQKKYARSVYVPFKEIFKAFALIIAHLLYCLEENRITWQDFLADVPGSRSPSQEQTRGNLLIHSFISTSVHSPGITLGNKMPPFVHMEAQRFLLSVTSVASVVVTRHQVNQNPTASAGEVMPLLSYCLQYGS